MSRLLLFTNDYPYDRGDAGFVGSEIDALAAAFDSVVVFCHERDTSVGTVPMPPNVTFGGNLFEPAPEDAPRQLLTTANVAAFATAAWRELLAGRLLSHLKLFAMGAKVGLTQANRAAVRAAIAGDADTVAYAFWGMGGGLGLAWLRGVRGRAVRLHRYDLYEYASPEGYLPFRPYLFSRADRVLAISEDARRYLAATYRSAALDRKTVVSRLGVAGPDVVKRMPRTPDRLVVSASAVTEVKRVGLLLEALRALAATLPAAESLRWVHFGDGPLLPELRRAASVLPACLTVELRGQTPNDELRAFYSANRVDAFVNVSSNEGVPVSIMEALAYDIPVVATAVGGTPEVVGRELGSGELVPGDATAGDIGHAIGRVLAAADDAYRPRAVWERLSDARVTSAHTVELLLGLLDRPGVSRPSP